MLYRTKRLFGATTRVLALPIIGMALAVSVSSTKAWAPISLIKSSAPIVIHLN